MKLLKTTKCLKCGMQIVKKHLQEGWLKIQADKGFLGGKRIKFQKVICDCGMEYVALMETKGNNFKFIDLIETEQPVRETEPLEGVIEKTGEEVKEMPEKPIDLENIKRQELLKMAKELGIQGKIGSMSNILLRKAIMEIWK